jgi:hypothetical protein
VAEVTIEIPHLEDALNKLAGNLGKSSLWTVITPMRGIDTNNDFETDGLVR